MEHDERPALPRRELSPAVMLGGVLALALLIACSIWQQGQLRALQLQDKQALYAERLRTAQVIIENELLAGAYLTTVDERTRERARHYLQGSPK